MHTICTITKTHNAYVFESVYKLNIQKHKKIYKNIYKNAAGGFHVFLAYFKLSKKKPYFGKCKLKGDRRAGMYIKKCLTTIDCKIRTLVSLALGIIIETTIKQFYISDK